MELWSGSDRAPEERPTAWPERSEKEAMMELSSEGGGFQAEGRAGASAGVRGCAARAGNAERLCHGMSLLK